MVAFMIQQNSRNPNCSQLSFSQTTARRHKFFSIALFVWQKSIGIKDWRSLPYRQTIQKRFCRMNCLIRHWVILSPRWHCGQRELQYPFPYLYDGKTQEVAKAYGVRVTPHAFLFDKKRKLRYSGRIGDPKNPDREDREELRIAINSLNHGIEPAVVRGLVFGNSIKWIKDRIIAEKTRERFARESVYLKKANIRTLKFVRRNDSKLPKLIYVWSNQDKNNRQELLQLAAIHKIYRKRGLKLVTICVDGNDFTDVAKKLLIETQSSGTNYICLRHRNFSSC